MELKYVGIHDSVDVPLDLGGWRQVARNETISVSDDQGAAMLEQPANWEVVQENKSRSESRAQPTEDSE
jgi:hypothetical protein